MLVEYDFNKNNAEFIRTEFISDWNKVDKKVFVFRNKQERITPKDLANFYEDFLSDVGEFLSLAEDASITSDRSKQRTGEIWMEIRNDNFIPNAYRHSCAAQPFHTDGSYIPDYPQTLLACVKNVADGGETIFINLEQISADLEKNDPDLFEGLLSENIIHARSGDERLSKILYRRDGTLKANFNGFCVSEDNSERAKILCKDFLNYLIDIEQMKNPAVNITKVKLNTGDAVICKDDEVLHGRHKFNAKRNSDRHILKCVFRVNRSK